MPKLTEPILHATSKVAVATKTTRVLWDSEVRGFGAKLFPTGKVSFVLRYRVGEGGRTARMRELKIHAETAYSVDAARKAARAQLAEVLKGADPVATRKVKRLAPNVAAVFQDWLKAVGRRAKPATVAEYRRLWEHDIEEPLGRHKVADVTEADVRAIHVSMAARPAMANRVRARLQTFFAWCEDEGHRPRHSNPVTIKPYEEREKSRFLKQEDFAPLFAAMDRALSDGLPAAPEFAKKSGGKATARKSRRDPTKRAYTVSDKRRQARGPYDAKGKPPRLNRANPHAIAAIRFLLFSGWREQEALTLRWDALDIQRGAASLADTKTGASWCPLSTIALELIASQERRADNPYVFAGAKAGQPLREIKRVWYAVRYAAGLRDVRLHDLRHSHASVMASSGASLLIIGKALGHKDQKSTQRYAKLFSDPVRAASQRAAEDMRAWGEDKTTPVTPLRPTASE